RGGSDVPRRDGRGGARGAPRALGGRRAEVARRVAGRCPQDPRGAKPLLRLPYGWESSAWAAGSRLEPRRRCDRSCAGKSLESRPPPAPKGTPSIMTVPSSPLPTLPYQTSVGTAHGRFTVWDCEEDRPKNKNATAAGPAVRDIPIDWEALEDAFENNAPE